jgi:hypothetical protein
MRAMPRADVTGSIALPFEDAADQRKRAGIPGQANTYAP